MALQLMDPTQRTHAMQLGRPGRFLKRLPRHEHAYHVLASIPKGLESGQPELGAHHHGIGLPREKGPAILGQEENRSGQGVAWDHKRVAPVLGLRGGG